jgi:hypothetical protein
VHDVFNHFVEYERAYEEKRSYYDHFTEDYPSEALDTFRVELL